jgi:RimJ/RimL family protein N-acetyltransferase
VLEGASLRLRPIRDDDLEPLFAVASDPLLWAQHPAKTRSQRPVFEHWFASALAGHALVFEARADGRVLGSSRYYDWRPWPRDVAIGYTFIARDQWGGTVNRELKALMLTHAFRFVDRVWFHVNPDNRRSQLAMLKIGGVVSHTGVHAIGREPPAEYVHFRIDVADWRAASAPAT